MIRQIAHLQLITDQPAVLVGFYTEILRRRTDWKPAALGE